MNWLELVVETDGHSSEELETLLLEHGAQALTLSDAGDEPVLEPGPGETPVWSQVRITALFDQHVDQQPIEHALRATHPSSFRQWRTLKDQQWERVWLSRFKPRQFGRRLWVIPSGSEPADGDAISLFLDPGLAFGTGDHATTSLCLKWLDATDLEHKRVLDYGSGSGILAIAAHKLGAVDVLGIDIDPQAITAGRANAERNHVEDIQFQTTDVDDDFDVVIANILAQPLLGLAPRLCRYVRSGGQMALSGILADQADSVMAAYAPWIQWQQTDQQEDWVLLYGVRNDKVSA